MFHSRLHYLFFICRAIRESSAMVAAALKSVGRARERWHPDMYYAQATSAVSAAMAARTSSGATEAVGGSGAAATASTAAAATAAGAAEAVAGGAWKVPSKEVEAACDAVGAVLEGCDGCLRLLDRAAGQLVTVEAAVNPYTSQLVG